MMNTPIDLDTLLAPIEGENPCGENLRYEPIYDEIKEARREDDQLDQGEWQTSVKVADWPLVIQLCTEVLTDKSKDLQIAIWLLEGLIVREGLEGLITGLQVINGLLENFWDNVYPEIEEDDLDFRGAPFDFLNEKLWLLIKKIPVTDPKNTAGYDSLRWQESRQVGFDKDILNKFGDVDRDKQAAREALIADGKIKAEEFDSAVGMSSASFYQSLVDQVNAGHDEFKKMDATLDDKFGNEAPRLSEFRTALEELDQLVGKVAKGKIFAEDDSGAVSENGDQDTADGENEGADMQDSGIAQPVMVAGGIQGQFRPSMRPNDLTGEEAGAWDTALATYKASGIKAGLDLLYNATCSASSIRQENRYRLFMVKLCLRANKPTLARPIIEELYAVLEDLQLRRWESPLWIADVIDALYQCLTMGEASDDDLYRAQGLLQEICKLDVTKAMSYNAE